MATPPVPHIKSAARKLPIKRKSPTQQPPPLVAPKSEPYTATADDEVDDEFDGRYDNNEEEDDDDDNSADLKAPPPPFKFHRIWSEPDEIRFLQGLLGCFSQGLVFPRDLNLFYDRFSESMPQPYTRSQLSEKLRRLRKKFRIMSARIARGQDPARLAPHDRDLLHLCTRLWDPAHAATSPFSSATEGSSGAPVGNKRRRPNPRPPATRPSSSAVPAADVTLAADGNPAADTAPVVFEGEEKPLALLPPPLTASADAGAAKAGSGLMLAKTVLGVFDGVLNELRATLLGGGVIQQNGEGAVQPEYSEGAVQTENSEGLFQLENDKGVIQLESSEGTVLLESNEGVVLPENIGGAVQLEGNEGVVQPENKEGAIQPENSEVGFQLGNNVSVILPENNDVAFQRENNAGAVLPENREEAVQPENSGRVVQPKISVTSASTGKDFTRRWQEQRLAELGVLASRLRLVIEDSIRG